MSKTKIPGSLWGVGSIVVVHVSEDTNFELVTSHPSSILLV